MVVPKSKSLDFQAMRQPLSRRRRCNRGSTQTTRRPSMPQWAKLCCRWCRRTAVVRYVSSTSTRDIGLWLQFGTLPLLPTVHYEHYMCFPLFHNPCNQFVLYNSSWEHAHSDELASMNYDVLKQQCLIFKTTTLRPYSTFSHSSNQAAWFHMETKMATRARTTVRWRWDTFV